jgi:hypothetical protein
MNQYFVAGRVYRAELDSVISIKCSNELFSVVPIIEPQKVSVRLHQTRSARYT